MKSIPILAALAAVLLPPFAMAQSSGAFSFGKQKIETSAETVEVTAKGQGESVDAAKKDAVRNAIKMAVGELVDAKTLVENDELVEDKILTLSNAIVEKAEYGDAKAIGDGLYEVSVKSLVKKGRLNQELEKIGIAKGRISGKDLAAPLVSLNVRNMSDEERVASAEEFLAERLKGFPGALVEAVMLAKGDGSPDIGIDEKTGHVFANAGVQVNMENYTKWTQALCELLGQMCMAQEDVPIKFNEEDSPFPDRIASDAIPLRSFSKEEVFGSPDLTGFPVSMAVVVAVPSASKVRRSTWPAKVFYLNSKMWNAFMRKFAERFPESGYVEITLKDRDGDPVCAGRETFTIVKNGVSILGSRSHVPAHAISTSGTWKAFIAPALKLDGKRGGLERNRDLAVKMRIDLGKAEEDDLAAVVGYDVKLEYR